MNAIPVRPRIAAVLAAALAVAFSACTFDVEYGAAAGDAALRSDGVALDGGPPGTDAMAMAGDSGPDAMTPPGDSGMNGSDSGSGTDAGTDAAMDGGLAALGPFAAPTLMTTVSDPGAVDDDPTLTADLLELYFNSNRGGGLGGGDIWVSTRATSAAAWGTPTLVVELSSTSGETTPEISPDGLTIWIASSRPGGLGGNDIWVSTRISRMSPWQAPQHVPELSSAAADAAPAPTSDLLRLVLISQRSGGFGSWDLYASDRLSIVSTWSPPANIVELNTGGSEDAAWMSPRALVLYFTTDRPGGMGLDDLWLATRLDAADPFGPPTAVTELNSAAQDRDPWLTDDLRCIYFYSERSGNGDLYEACR